MKLFTRLVKAILVIAYLLPGLVKAQSLPVGTPLLEDYYRRAQFLGQVDSSISFTSRPIFPASLLKLKNVFDPDSSLENARKTKSDGIFRFFGKSGAAVMLFNHHNYTDVIVIDIADNKFYLADNKYGASDYSK